MSKKRVIAIFSGNRAEYGLQFPILQAVKNHPDLEYKLIVSGAHLDKNFGSTISEIKNDGFEIYAEVEIEMAGDTRTSTSLAIASGINNLTPVLDKLNPDIFLVYADRFEGLAAVITSTQMNIPTAHVEGEILQKAVLWMIQLDMLCLNLHTYIILQMNRQPIEF